MPRSIRRVRPASGKSPLSVSVKLALEEQGTSVSLDEIMARRSGKTEAKSLAGLESWPNVSEVSKRLAV